MHDFGPLVYLDLHKTGSTYVSAFLKSCCVLPQIKLIKHGWIRDDYSADKFYFITIRNPISLYSSLYRYGLDHRGDVFGRLKAGNMLSAYSSLNSFIEFSMQPENAKLLGFGYNEALSREVGFMSFRFLKMSLNHPMQRIKNLPRKFKLSELQKQFITNLEIKNEFLDEGLKKLSGELFPQFFDSAKVEEFFSANKRVNSSSRPESEIDTEISENLMAILRQKESLLFSRYNE